MTYIPLSTLLRPQSIDGFVGQSHLMSANKPFRKLLEQGKLHSMILWGPPGTGKTTLANLMSKTSQSKFEKISALTAGVKELREIASIGQDLKSIGRTFIVFIDEIHRFNKAQQDALLPYIEDGTFIVIGATTENPSFAINHALLSRMRVYILRALESKDLLKLIQTSIAQLSYQYERPIVMEDALQEKLASMVDGDARKLIQHIEMLIDIADDECGQYIIREHHVFEVTQYQPKHFDNKGDVFYDQISALHKSVRGSDPNAAIYWLCRMLDAGCDPLYIGRRIIRMASEDIGLADPKALEMSLQAVSAYERLGSPEGELALVQAVTYLACTSKSDAIYQAYNKARKHIQESGSYAVPIHLRNATTSFNKELGVGKEYRNPHCYPHGYIADETYFPNEMLAEKFYQPTDRGLENKIKARLEQLKSTKP
jgi:putative ATPase